MCIGQVKDTGSDLIAIFLGNFEDIFLMQIFKKKEEFRVLIMLSSYVERFSWCEE